MKSFLNYLYEQEGQLDEAGIKFDGKYEFPESDHVLFMTGGAGSGKGFILGNLLLFKGKVLNKDDVQTELMTYMQKHPDSEMAKKFKQRFGDIPKDQLSPRKTPVADRDKEGNPLKYSDTEKLHHFAKKYYDNQMDTFISGAGQAITGKPNIIFDITGSELGDLTKRVEKVVAAGYDPKNIHIAWVVTDVAEAVDNNAARDRYVPVSILRKSHADVKQTMEQLIIMDHDKLKKIMDGHFFIVFNKKKYDTQVVTHKNRNANTDLKGKAIWTPKGSRDTNPAYIACHCKKPGEAVDWNVIHKFEDKIMSYLTPADMTDGDKLDIALDILDDEQITKYEDYVRTEKKAKHNLTNSDKLKYVMDMMHTLQIEEFKRRLPQYQNDVVDKYVESADK